MTIPRALVPVAIAASFLLAACSSPTPTDGAGGDDPTSAPSETAQAPLDYPFYFDEAIQDAVVAVQTDVAVWYESFTTLDCTAEEATDEATYCPQSLVAGLQLANGLNNTVFGVDAADFETSSGMANFKPVWDASHAAAEGGAVWAGSCQYGPANEGCEDKAAALIADLTAFAGVFADWRP